MYTKEPHKNFKFDIEFALKLLIEIEIAEIKTFKTIHQRIELDCETNKNMIGYHLVKLEEGGLLELEKSEIESGLIIIQFATPTFKGHEFIKNMSNDNVKSRLLNMIKNSSGQVSIGTLISLASKFSIEAFSL